MRQQIQSNNVLLSWMLGSESSILYVLYNQLAFRQYYRHREDLGGILCSGLTEINNKHAKKHKNS